MPPDLLQQLQALAPLTAADWTAMAAVLRRRELGRGNFFCRAGTVCTEMAFVEKGLLRLFYPLPEGQEKTMLFFRAGSLAGDYFSFLTETPSLRPVEALEPCVLWSVGRSDLMALYQRPAWAQVGRHLAEQAYLYAAHRANRLLHDSPDTRYQTLLAEDPDLLQRVPQYLIASYLDLTPETLSRVKRRLQAQGPAPDSVHGPLRQVPW